MVIVRLLRPDDPSGLWLLYAPGIEPCGARLPDEIAGRIEGSSAYFTAEQTEDGWDIGERVEDRGW